MTNARYGGSLCPKTHHLQYIASEGSTGVGVVEAEHQGSEPGITQDDSEKVMVEECLAPGGQYYNLCQVEMEGGTAGKRNTAREKTESHYVRTANTVKCTAECHSSCSASTEIHFSLELLVYYSKFASNALLSHLHQGNCREHCFSNNNI
jgi:hypothetical protein